MTIQDKKLNPLKKLFPKRKAAAKTERDLPLFQAMREGKEIGDKQWQRSAKDHLWMHFTRHSPFQSADMPIITKGEGIYIWDSKGRKAIDGLSGLFAVNAGHARPELAAAAAKQIMELDFMPLWSYAHPRAIGD